MMTMRAVVGHESMYGNIHLVADANGVGLAGQPGEPIRSAARRKAGCCR